MILQSAHRLPGPSDLRLCGIGVLCSPLEFSLQAELASQVLTSCLTSFPLLQAELLLDLGIRYKGAHSHSLTVESSVF